MTSSRLARRIMSLTLVVVFSAVGSGAVLAQEAGTVRLEGTIYDARGVPVPECRVIVRVLEGSEVFVSTPSGEGGRYAVDLPAGRNYLIVAAVAPTGGRAPVRDPAPIEADSPVVTQDIYLPMSAEPGPRHAAKALEGSDRLFLSFIEDPLLVERQRYELQIEASDLDVADRIDGRLVAGWQFAQLPRIEVGLRGGFATLDTDLPLPDDSGLTDTDVWGKFHIRRSAAGRTDLAIGSVFTLPTGDDDAGLGMDALQSKPFFAVSHIVGASVVVGHVAVRLSEDGTLFGVPIKAETAPSAGFGVVVPFGSRFTLIVEAAWEAERFEGFEPEGRVLAGINWRPRPNGTLRAAVSGGFEDGSPDTALLVGWAFDF
jgi:hypothetical protein